MLRAEEIFAPFDTKLLCILAFTSLNSQKTVYKQDDIRFWLVTHGIM